MFVLCLCDVYIFSLWLCIIIMIYTVSRKWYESKNNNNFLKWWNVWHDIQLIFRLENASATRVTEIVLSNKRFKGSQCHWKMATDHVLNTKWRESIEIVRKIDNVNRRDWFEESMFYAVLFWLFINRAKLKHLNSAFFDFIQKTKPIYYSFGMSDYRCIDLDTN